MKTFIILYLIALCLSIDIKFKNYSDIVSGAILCAYIIGGFISLILLSYIVIDRCNLVLT